MTKNELIKKLENVEKKASASKFKRMLMGPFKYINAILFREIFYRINKREREVISETFFGVKMHLLLPSSTDIYITGGKSHKSETRLAKFMINNLESGDTFADVGAHYGYFTLLASVLVGDKGKVYSFEASPTNYKVHSKNTLKRTNIHSFNLAVSDEASELKFYEFPNLYSEYNTLYVGQLSNENWFSEYKPREINVKSVILDALLHDTKLYPKIIKIDVEGAELGVINGLRNYLSKNSPFLVMEYLSKERGNEGHKRAENILRSLGYLSFVIDKSGNLKKLDSIPEYLDDEELESDNIVFSRSRFVKI